MKRSLAVVALLALPLAACNDSGGSGSSESATGTGSTSTKTEKAGVASGGVKKASNSTIEMQIGEVEDPFTPQRDVDRASAGTRLVRAHVTLTQLSSDNTYVSGMSVSGHSGGKQLATRMLIGQQLESLEGKKLAKGEKTSGSIIFEVPNGGKLDEISYQGLTPGKGFDEPLRVKL